MKDRTKEQEINKENFYFNTFRSIKLNPLKETVNKKHLQKTSWKMILKM
jgi:hypothetical protein